jgi:hypothetical protein
MVSSVIRFPSGLGYWRKISAGFSPLNDSLLLAQRYLLAVLLGRPHASQMNFFLKNQATLDDQDLLDEGKHRGITLLPNGRNGVDWTPYWHALNFYALMSEALGDQVVMSDRLYLHPNVALDFPALN